MGAGRAAAVQCGFLQRAQAERSCAACAQGGNITITAAVLSASDPDNDAAELVFTVGSTIKGTVLLNGAPTSSFTQADIASGRVSFLHDGSEGADAGFYFTVSDGAISTASALFDIDVTPTADPPEVTVVGGSMAEVRAGRGRARLRPEPAWGWGAERGVRSSRPLLMLCGLRAGRHADPQDRKSVV